MNVGFINPRKVIQDSLDFSEEHEIPINSTEGFIRQILGWREFIRGIYCVKGSYESCLLYTSPSPRDRTRSRMPSSA